MSPVRPQGRQINPQGRMVDFHPARALGPPEVILVIVDVVSG